MTLPILPTTVVGSYSMPGWLERLKTIIPTYGIDLKKDAAAIRKTRAETAAVLRLENV